MKIKFRLDQYKMSNVGMDFVCFRSWSFIISIGEFVTWQKTQSPTLKLHVLSGLASTMTEFL